MHLDRFSAELEDLMLLQEVIGSDISCGESKLRQRFEHLPDLLSVGVNQDIQIASEARRAMIADGVSPDNQKLNALFGQ